MSGCGVRGIPHVGSPERDSSGGLWGGAGLVLHPRKVGGVGRHWARIGSTEAARGTTTTDSGQAEWKFSFFAGSFFLMSVD